VNKFFAVYKNPVERKVRRRWTSEKVSTDGRFWVSPRGMRLAQVEMVGAGCPTNLIHAFNRYLCCPESTSSFR